MVSLPFIVVLGDITCSQGLHSPSICSTSEQLMIKQSGVVSGGRQRTDGWEVCGEA